MKKTLQFAPAFIIAAAALLCLSFDNNGKLFAKKISENQTEHFRTGGTGIWKIVLDKCPDGSAKIDCQTGGSLECEVRDCPTTVTTVVE